MRLFRPASSLLALQDAVVTRHPVRQNEVDACTFNCAGAPAVKQKRAALPKKVRAHPFDDRHHSTPSVVGRRTSSIFAGCLPKINNPIISGTFQPLVEQDDGFLVANRIGAIQGSVNHVEPRLCAERAYSD